LFARSGDSCLHETEPDRRFARAAEPRQAGYLPDVTEPVPADPGTEDGRWRHRGSWLPDAVETVLISFEAVLYVAVGLLLAVAAVLVLAGTVTGLVHAVDQGKGAVEVAVLVLDRILLLLIVAELVYTLRFVLRTHEIVVEPFLYIGLIAVVRRILIVTAEFERAAVSGRALTNLLLELGLLALLVLALAAAIFLVRRSQQPRSAT
jgi:uncharacterized membrane protein (DUF373 family)